jgi:antitoxin (DNA-binding transcriptional repressor) of toxin-antitoxin stability system
MGVIKIDDMKDQVEELVSRAEAGETILIEKDGKTVARLEGIINQRPESSKPDQRFDWDALKRFTDSQPLQSESAGDFIRRMRDEARY